MIESSVISNFYTEMVKVGLDCPAQPIPDGEFHRFNVENDKSKPCWYKLTIFPNGMAFGVFGCFKWGISESWCSHSQDKWLDHDRRVIEDERQKSHKKLIEMQEQAKQEVLSLWDRAASSVLEHGYLQSKQIKSYGLRLLKERLLVPLVNEDLELRSLQFITVTGSKWFIKNAPVKGCCHIIGGEGDVVYLAEGYATAATIHEATGCMVFVAFYAGNLQLVAKIVRRKYPSKEIVICADNDAFNKSGNVGVEKAEASAKDIGAKVVVPAFKNIDTKPTDFNDLMQLEGLSEVQRQLADAKSVVLTDGDNKKQNQTSKVVELVNEAELFHDGQGVTYAMIINNGHKETMRLQSASFHNWLSHRYWSKYKNAVGKNGLQDAIGALEGGALFEGEKKEVYVRIAELEGAIYVDLANNNWDVIKITKDGWSIDQKPPVNFVRSENMQELPVPVDGVEFDVFWQFVNIPERYRRLVLGYLLECFRLGTPHLLMVIYGVQGSAKSTTQELLRMLIDPSAVNLRNAPKKSDEIFVAAANNWLVSFNNVSHLTASQQDDLCNLSTGCGFSTRKLYTTHDEAVVNVKRPVVVNGITDLITAQDLIDRCLILELPEIGENNRKTEGEVKRDFMMHYPAIFGALLSILSKVLKELPNIKLSNKPRMADFAELGAALDNVMGWEKGSFMNDYNQNRKDNMSIAIEHSPVAVALLNYINKEKSFSGNYEDLFRALNRNKPDMFGWPKSARGLAGQIKRQKKALASVGIEVTTDDVRHRDGYRVHIRKVEDDVHNVHEVHQTIVEEGGQGELMREHVQADTVCTRQVHA